MANNKNSRTVLVVNIHAARTFAEKTLYMITGSPGLPGDNFSPRYAAELEGLHRRGQIIFRDGGWYPNKRVAS